MEGAVVRRGPPGGPGACTTTQPAFWSHLGWTELAPGTGQLGQSPVVKGVHRGHPEGGSIPPTGIGAFTPVQHMSMVFDQLLVRQGSPSTHPP
jgi:hypothetical protein